jgi:hypothetical protein
LFHFTKSPRPHDWLSRDLGKFEEAERFLMWKSKRYGSQNEFRDYVAYRESRRKEGVLPTIVLDDESVWDDLKAYLDTSNKFGLAMNNRRLDVPFKDKLVSQLHVQNSKHIKLDTCEVHELEIGRGEFNLENVEIRNSKIKRLTLSGKIHRLDLYNCEVGVLRVRNPFEIIGPVSLTGTKFSDAHVEVQHMRTLRGKLTDIHNYDPAGIVHAVDLRNSRRRLGHLECFISRLYDEGSAYGTESWRAATWVIIAMALNFDFLMLSDGTAVGRTTDLRGWQEYLSTGSYSPAWRAAYLAFAQTFNPAGLFGPLSLVVTKHPWIALISSFIGLVGTGAFALFLLAVRRRFRLEG